jgi:hypothetical protein
MQRLTYVLHRWVEDDHTKVLKRFGVALIVVLGLVALYTLLYGYVYDLDFGAQDWRNAFRGGARGDFSLVVTPYWSLLLSFVPAQLPEPLGYALWIGLGAILVVLAAMHFHSPLWLVLLSYQLNWCLFYGQVDLYIVFGIALGHWAYQNAKPAIIGVAILLLLIKPQVGLLPSLVLLWWSPNRKVTLMVIMAVVLLSLVLWPGWPMTLVCKWTIFTEQAENVFSNTSLHLPWWLAVAVSSAVLIIPLDSERKLLALVAAGLLVSPYSPVYSHLALLCFALPVPFYIFALIPWIVAIVAGPFNHWAWMALFPISVLLYCYIPLLWVSVVSNLRGRHGV